MSFINRKSKRSVKAIEMVSDTVPNLLLRNDGSQVVDSSLAQSWKPRTHSINRVHWHMPVLPARGRWAGEFGVQGYLWLYVGSSLGCVRS